MKERTWNCGDGVTAALSKNGTLTISGTGAVVYNSNGKPRWNTVRNAITAIVIEEGITSIPKGAFRECRNAASVVIPNSVAIIEDGAFFCCSAITSVAISKNVSAIGYMAFFGCSALTSIDMDADNAYFTSVDGVLYNKDKTKLVQYPCAKTGVFTLPGSVTGIDYYALQDCDGVTSIDAAPDNTEFCSQDGVLFSKNMAVLMRYPPLRQGAYTIPDGVRVIINRAFHNCRGLTEIAIPDSMEEIEERAFDFCKSLSSVVIPNGVTVIEECTFYGCGISSVTIPNSVTSIEKSAFANCDNLTSVTIPNSVTNIGDYAFRGSGITSVMIPDSMTNIGKGILDACDNLKEINVSEGNGVYSSEGGSLLNKDKTALIKSPSCAGTEVTIPAIVTTIGENALRYGQLKSVTCLNPEPPVFEDSHEPDGRCLPLEPYGYLMLPIFTPLYVPKGSIDAYKKAPGWRHFFDIRGL